MTNAERWKMAEQVLPMVRYLLFRRRVPVEKWPDILQDCTIKLYERAIDYDPSKARWTTFAGWIIRGEIRRSIDRSQEYGPVNIEITKPKRVGVFHMTERGGDDGGAEQVELSIEAERAAKHLSGLPPQERAIVTRSLGGETLKEIGASFGFSRQRAEQLRKRAMGRVERSVARARP